MKTLLAAIQWMAFMIAGTIVAPIAVADLFQLSPVETSDFVQRTIFVLGASTFLQALFGHRLPINEGPAGLWWGVFAIYASLGTAMFTSKFETLQALQGAMIISGLVFFGLSLFKLVEKLASLFTPVVSGIYLLLLILQLSKSFLNGMFGIGYRQAGLDLPIAGFSIAMVLMTFYLSRHKIRWISQYSILISLAAGWIAFYLFGLAKPYAVHSQGLIKLPELFTFGKPIFHPGLILTSVFITLLLVTNMLASIRVTGEVLKQKGEEAVTDRYRAGGFVAGINQLLGGVFSAIGSVPISGAAGFIATTGFTKVLPILVSSVLIMGASLNPTLMSFIASLPAPVGYSVTFVIFANMVGIAFSEFDREEDKQRTRLVIGVSILTGAGAMFVSSTAFNDVSPILTSVLNNGLILGTLIAIFTDQLTMKNKR
ncbi:purine/pyrimidine permease [Mesobacillus zeae]|uniref:Purine permease n=1 Tax=Mesobacillus zeae TaxID=1917180 RepID=A0A398B8H1_9BACI|nr:purine/pyrimidine permease [Mesobacillus zeae]RID85784.1 purine permease [Mesobacillus zeae]